MWECGRLPGENGPGGVKVLSRNQLVQDQDSASRRPGPDHVLVAGNKMEVVGSFCYHDSHVEADGGSGPEVRRRVAIARDCMSSLQRGIWKSSIRIDTKPLLFKVYILPRGLGGVVGLKLPVALAAAVRVPYTTSPCSDLGQVVNLSLSVA